MNKMIFCIVIILLAVSIIVTPAAAGAFSSRIPNIYYAKSNSFSLGVKDMSTKIAYIPAIQSFNSRLISPSGFTGAGTGITISTGEWNTRFGL